MGTNPLSFNVLEALFFTKPTIGVHFSRVTFDSLPCRNGYPQVGLASCVSEPGINYQRRNIAVNSQKNFEPAPLDGL